MVSLPSPLSVSVTPFLSVRRESEPSSRMKREEEGAGRTKQVEQEPPPLLPRVAAGDELALKECFQRYRRLVYSLSWRMLRDERDVEDAFQDIFVALWKNAAAFDPSRGSEATFVVLVARRRLIDRTRLTRTRSLADLGSGIAALEGSPSTSEPSLDNYIDAKNAVAALSACSEHQRHVIMLSALHGLTHEEISTELSLPLGTVKSHYARGIERVKRALKGDAE